MNARQRRKARRAFERRWFIGLSTNDAVRLASLTRQHQAIVLSTYETEPWGEYKSRTQRNRHRRIRGAIDRLESKAWGVLR